MPMLDDKELTRLMQEAAKRESVLKEQLKKVQFNKALFKKLRKLLQQMAASSQE